MDFFKGLEVLIRAQDDENLSVPEILAKMGTPSASLAILDHGEIFARTFSTLGHNTETLFQACSISKPVAALAAMKMVEADQLRLDAPISDYLSAASLELITTPSTRKMINFITIKKLMSHTSGLSQGGFPGYSCEDISTIPNLHSVISGSKGVNTPRIQLSGLPGHRFSYAGGGTTVLQLILEEVSGKPFPDLIHELVLAPLNMHSSFYKTPAAGSNFASAYWTGYTPCNPPFHILPEQAAAGLWTTPTDLLKIVRALQDSLSKPSSDGDDDNNDDNNDDKNPPTIAFLPQSLAREMLTEISTGVALGWNAPKDPGTAFAHSGGNMPGYRCFLIGYADLLGAAGSGGSGGGSALDVRCERSGMCIMTNAATGTGVIAKLLFAIAHLKRWPAFETMEFLGELIPFHVLDAQADERWKEWSGAWGEGWELGEHDGAPGVCFGDLPPVRLLVAARPRPKVKAEQGQDEVIDLVLEGLEVMLRLTEDEEGGGEKVVQVWHGPRQQKETLRRAKKE